MPKDNETYRTTELAKKWDVSTATVIRMIQEKNVNGFKICGTWRIDKSSVDKYEREMKK